MYSQWGATSANVSVGLLSSIVDNIPVMFAVLAMNPDMSTGQWLLVTLTAGVGGVLLSIGSAAGVAPDGAGARYVYLLRALALDARDCNGLRRQYFCSYVDQCILFLIQTMMRTSKGGQP
jgi:hypothetical protein